MATTFNIPNTPLAVGENPFGPFIVPANVSTVTLHFNPRTLFNDAGGFQLLAQLWIDVSVDGGVTWKDGQYGSGIFSNPAFVDGKTGSTTDAFSRWSPLPSPCQLRLRAQAVVAFTFAGSIVVS